MNDKVKVNIPECSGCGEKIHPGDPACAVQTGYIDEMGEFVRTDSISQLFHTAGCLNSEEHCSDDLVIDFAGHRVSVGKREINLTITEYRVLSYLANNAGRVVTSDRILEKVWGENCIGDIHLLQVSMARLRKKLGDDARNPRYILTRPGIGYMMVEKKGK